MTYAFGDGIDAFDDGKPCHSNPHHYDANDGSDWSEWRAGWRAAERRAERNGAFTELPDSVRVPLGEVWADLQSHFARAAREGRSVAAYLAQHNCRKIEMANDAIQHALRNQSFPADASEAMISAMLVEVERGRGSGSMADFMRRIWMAGENARIGAKA